MWKSFALTCEQITFPREDKAAKGGGGWSVAGKLVVAVPAGGGGSSRIRCRGVRGGRRDLHGYAVARRRRGHAGQGCRKNACGITQSARISVIPGGRGGRGGLGRGGLWPWRPEAGAGVWAWTPGAGVMAPPAGGNIYPVAEDSP